MKQQTIAAPFTLSGKGLHTGVNVTLTLNPAPDNTGYLIRRTDLVGREEVTEMRATADNVASTERGTVLKRGACTVSTVEHCLSALYALGVDNCLMEVDGPEFPILDGSATPFVQGIKSVGLKEQQYERKEYIVTSKTTFTLGSSNITLVPDDEFSAQVMVGYDSPILCNQYAILDTMKDYEAEISACRTFVFVREIEQLLEAGLIKGGDLENALVIYDRPSTPERLNQIAKLCGAQPRENYELGFINGPLKFQNEPARHKLLDLIGDLALIGIRLRGRVIAVHPGHKINTAFAQTLHKKTSRQEVTVPVLRHGAKPVFDINDIKRMLPHRYPMLLVDRVVEMGDMHVVGVKNVTFDEPYFMGHFPNEPVMPGVLQVEAMAQTIGLLVLSKVDDPENYSTYFLSIDNVKFRNKVVPGDTMVIKMVLTSPIRRGLASIKGFIFVDGQVVTEAEMVAAIRHN